MESLTNRILPATIITDTTSPLPFHQSNMIPSQNPNITQPDGADGVSRSRQETNRDRESPSLDPLQRRGSGRGRGRGHRRRRRQKWSPPRRLIPFSRYDGERMNWGDHAPYFRRHGGQGYNDYLANRSPTSDEEYEEHVQEILLDTYYDERTDPLERWNREQVDHLEATTAKDQRMMQEEDGERAETLKAAENYDEDNNLEKRRLHEEWDQSQLQSMDSQNSTSSYTTITDELEQLRQIQELEMSDEEQATHMNQRDQLQLQSWEESLSKTPKKR